jgi:hypothetical protein
MATSRAKDLFCRVEARLDSRLTDVATGFPPEVEELLEMQNK